jgi:signal transduction histidine kinase
MIFRLLNYSLIILLLCLGGCAQQSKTMVPPLAVKGVLDLTNWDLERDGPVKLNGQYEFYWNQLLNPQDFIQQSSSLKTDFIVVPSVWNGFEYQGKHIAGHGYATYRLRVLLNGNNTTLAIKSMDLGTSFDLFVNGQKLSSAGVVGKTAKTAKPGYCPEIIGFQPEGDSIDLVFQISNFSHILGGAWETIVLGARDHLQKNKELKITYNLFLFGSIFIMALYHLALFSLNRKEKAPLFFGLFCLIIALRILTTGERYILLFFPEINYEILIKIEYLTFYLAVPVFMQYFDSIFSNRVSKTIRRFSIVIGLVFSSLVLLFPVNIFSNTLSTYQVYTIFMFTYATIVLVLASLKKDIKAIIFLSGFSILFVLSVNDILYARSIIHTRYMVQFGLFIFIFSQAYLISRDFSQAFVTIKIQSEELKKAEISLKKTNDGLEKKIKERTADILETNEMLRKEIEGRKLAQKITKEAKTAAEVANRSKSEFLANMSHELRTPLNHILGFTELVLDKHFGELNEIQEEYLKDVYSSSTHLLSLINDILDLSKIEAGKIEYRPTKVHIREILTNSLIMIKEKAMKNHIKISTKWNDIPESIPADERKLKQILYNILSNAIKFTPAGGNIDLIAKRVSNLDIQGQNEKISPKELIQISIKDSGIGLKKENLEKIFQPFEQVETSSSRRFQGTGLGLSLTKNLVELHGGKIWAESQGEDLGTIFNFTLGAG